MDRRLFFLLVFGLFFTSCRDQDIDKLYTDELIFPDTLSLSAVTLNDSCQFIFVQKMVVADSLLIFLDCMHPEYFFHVYKTNGSWVKSFGKKGRGPGEIVSASNFVFDPVHDVIQVYNSAKEEIVEYSLVALMNNEQSCFKAYPLHTTVFPSGVIKCDTNLFLCLEMQDTCRFSLWEGCDLKFVYSGYPDIENTREKALARAILNYGGGCYSCSPDFKKFVTGSYIGAVLETFFLDGNRIKSKNIHRIYYPSCTKTTLKDGNKDVSWDETTKIGFEAITATNGYIYTLLNGIMGSELRKRDVKEPYTTKISVFDWECNPVLLVQTDRMLQAVCVDENARIIYGLAWNKGEHAIVKMEY